MAGLRKSTRFNMLTAVAEEQVVWEHGTPAAWKCDAIIGALFLHELIALASHAPTEEQLVETAASLCGVEANYPGSDNSYLREVANDLLPDALAEAARRLQRTRDVIAAHNDFIDALAR